MKFVTLYVIHLSGNDDKVSSSNVRDYGPKQIKPSGQRTQCMLFLSPDQALAFPTPSFPSLSLWRRSH